MVFRCIIVIVCTLLGTELPAQQATFCDFPTLDTTVHSIDAEQLLAELDWPRIAGFCDSTAGHYARISEGEDLTTYSYIKYLIFKEIGYLWR